jgi:CubicO group peptidase (beta-lactamase class C family)
LVDALDQIEYLHSVMVLRHGHVIAEGWWSPYAAESPHMLFSLSKSFTSTAIGLLVDEGRLSADDFVLPFFPDDAPASPSDNLKAMRVRHLLSMSTGHAEDTLGPVSLSGNPNWARGFLALPVAHAPGTHFVYNSGATYMLSAIVQRVTGQRLLHYLTPRLFQPLGIEGATWQQCPRGIDTGGWGLSIKTEDIAKFGQLYLQRGVWQGQQILSEAWVTEATSKHIDNATPDPSQPIDWAQGYGYQFWRSQHSAYRGDGAFGQFCVVMPDHDAVIAITSGVKDMQQVLDAVWEHLLPGLGDVKADNPLSQPLPVGERGQTPLPRGERAGAADAALKLSHLALTPQPGHAFSPVASRASGKRYAIEPNARGITALTFDFHLGRCTLTVHDAHGEHAIACGYRGWLPGVTTFQSDGTSHASCAASAASAAWASDEAYVIKLCYTETPFMNTLYCTFDEDALSVVLSSHVAFGPNEPTHLQGHLTP